MVSFLCRSVKYAGTVMTAFRTGIPVSRSAASFKVARINDDISAGVYDFPAIDTVSPLPIFLLTETTVFSGKAANWLRAGEPGDDLPILVDSND